MKSLKRYLLLLFVIAAVPCAVNAEISVKDTTSYEFIRNQGYSDEVHRVIEIKTKDPATPVAKEKRTKRESLKWYIKETVDPSITRPDKFVDHNINFNPSLEDL